MDPDLELLEGIKAKLLEHFDTVQIFVTRHDGQKDDTEAIRVGGGNFYARCGQVRRWLLDMEQEPIVPDEDDD